VSDNLEAAKMLFTQAAQQLLKEDYAGAEPLLRSALAHAPGRPSIVNNLAAALIGQGKFTEARSLARQATTATPDNAEAWLNLGRCLEADKDNAGALAAYDRALALKPDSADAWCNRGNIFKAQLDFPKAQEAYEKAIALRPDFAEALGNLAMLFLRMDKPTEAIPNIDRAIALKPDLPYAYDARLQARLSQCDWSSYDTDSAAVTRSIRDGRQSTLPFTFLTLPSDPQLQRRCAELYCSGKYTAEQAAPLPARPDSSPTLRIGYFSADMRRHAIGYLVAGLFEQHDRRRFEIHCFSYGPPSTDTMRQRLQAGVDRFHDVHDKSDADICALARRLQIDIAVDLTGYTRHERTGILARRAAPVQVNWLGFPGTMGAPFMDYIVADPVIIPPEHFAHYTEAVVHLPQTYQSTDNTRQISDRRFSRAEFGLPETGFVFCSFNNNYKITPDVFEIWMRLLGRVPGSVLWLLESSPGISGKLRQEAAKRGIAPERLVFAPRMASPEHLARQRLGDLFLDSFHYNAHTTASDALWAGLPVLTRIGNTFAGRVAASLLRAAGLPELVTQTTEEYEALALALAGDPARLQAIRLKLAAQRDTCALFDTARFTRGLEAAYHAMWDRHRQGQPPAPIAIDDREILAQMQIHNGALQ
jgi:predicted O-linked N-acetylglucosamine transferase (SPINDLY family)